MRSLRQLFVLLCLVGLVTPSFAVDSDNCADKDQPVDISVGELAHHGHIDYSTDKEEASDCCEAKECTRCVAGYVLTITASDQFFPVNLRTLTQSSLHANNLPPLLIDNLFRPPISH